MFNNKTCKKCGICLSGCPVIGMNPEKAKAEIVKMIGTRSSSEIDRNCARCSYCNVICPTNSNPCDLREEIFTAKTRKKGARSLALICREVPFNLMSIAIEHEAGDKERLLAKYENPPASEEIFYVGCSVSCLHPDLAQTRLLQGLPIVGGLKYCCGYHVHTLFGENESRIKGRQLLGELRKTGVKSVVTFCPSCDHMLGSVYPGIVKDFSIKTRTISEYLLDKHSAGDIKFTEKLNIKIAVLDPCAWRNMDEGKYEAPRKLLEAMGARLVEMKHGRRKSVCCGSTLSGKNPDLADQLAEKRIMEAKEAGADTIAVSCTGCFALAKKAAEHDIELYHIIELAQLAIGERPRHRIIEARERLVQDIYKKVGENPDAFNKRYIILNGEIRTL
jgi:heterodisulfide reductase subunit D